MTTVGFIGSGNIGSTVARLAVAAGYQVVLSNSRGPETLADKVAELGPRASAATSGEAAAAGDIVVVTVPLKAFPNVPATPLAGKTVIDTCNYYPERDGHVPELDGKMLTESELLLRYIPDAKLGFVTDIWSPGPQIPPANPGTISLVKGIQKMGIQMDRMAGGHGGVGNFADLAKTVQ